MANNSFSNLRIANNISFGNRLPIDDDTLALWVFDGSEINGYIKDWSGNNNHLVPNFPVTYDFAPFGKVLKVVSGLTFSSLFEPNIQKEQPGCFEILFSNNVENYESNLNPYVTASGIRNGSDGYVSTFISKSDVEQDQTVYFGIGRAGTIQTLFYTSLLGTINRDFYLPIINRDERFQNSLSPVSGDPYPNALYPKNWFGMAINFPLFENTNAEKNYYWLNGVKTLMEGSAYIRYYPFGGHSKFHLFPHPQFNFVKNVAYIRLSKRHRTPDEINSMLGYFGGANGNFSNIKFYNNTLGTYRLLNESAESAKCDEVSFDYKIPKIGFNYIRSGISSSDQEFYQNVKLVYSGLPIFDYNSIGASKGILIEHGKENYFKYNSDGSNLRSDFSNAGIKSYSPTIPAYVAPLNHDQCTSPVYGGYYGFSGPDGFHYWNLTKSLVNSGVYTISCWVKKTNKVSDRGFLMTFSQSGNNSPFYNFVSPYGEVIDAHELFDSTEHATNQLRFRFKSGDHYNNWQRLWVTFKMYTAGPMDRWQITHDNLTYNNRGSGDSFAIDCHQFEEGWLTSWKPEYLQSNNPGNTYFIMDLTNKVSKRHGTIIFDYLTNNTYSGFTTQHVRIFTLGSIELKQKESNIYLKDGFGVDRLVGACSIGNSQKIAVTWDLSKYVCVGYLLNSDTTISQTSNLIIDKELTNLNLITLSGTTLSGISYHISNMEFFNRALSLDELRTYN